jgi:CheY-like chemotaxis protein
MAQVSPPAAHRLLVVEDDADSAELIARAAGRCGYATKPAADASEMCAAISEWRPDVITLDLCLPHIDGIEVIAAIKQCGFAGPVIIVSGQPDWVRELTSKAAAECGLSVPAHMAKPIDLRRLRELLSGILASLRAVSATTSQ